MMSDAQRLDAQMTAARDGDGHGRRSGWIVCALAVSCASALSACGPAVDRVTTPVEADIGQSRSGTSANESRRPAVSGSIELTLRRSDGTFLDIGELRGAPVLILVLATFDTPSQMLLHPLRRILERHPEVQMVGVAAQPAARLLVEAYENALSPPFPITYDPEETVANGASALGPIGSVPTLIVLDERGVEVGRRAGFAQEPAIMELLSHASVSD